MKLKRCCCAFLAFLCVACSVEEGVAVLQGTRIQMGDTLPPFAVQTSSGMWVTRDSLWGKRSVIVFFHTQCPDCRKELPCVDSLYRAFRSDDDFRLICIARQEKEETISRFWTQCGFAMPYSPQKDRSVYQLFAYTKVPRIYISSPDGVVRYIHDDSHLPSFAHLSEEVSSLGLER